jgi:hypothetical protein
VMIFYDNLFYVFFYSHDEVLLYQRFIILIREIFHNPFFLFILIENILYVVILLSTRFLYHKFYFIIILLPLN